MKTLRYFHGWGRVKNHSPKTLLFASATRFCRTTGLVLSVLGACSWLVPEAKAQSCIPNSDHRFGTVGWSPDFKWWRNYNEDYTAADLSFETKMYTVGKLNDWQRYSNGRMTTEDWCSDGEVDPLKCFNDRVYPSDQRRIYTNIFEYDKENIRTIISKYGSGGSPYGYNGSTTLHFTIGNEPNWYPYVDPLVYAEIYKQYYDYIKGTLNCSKCVIHNGGIFLGNPLDNSLVLDFVDDAYSAFRWVLGKRSTRVQHYLTWTRRFMTRLSELGGRVDIFNVHPYNIEIMEGTSNAEQTMEAFLALIRGGKTKFRYGTLSNIAEGVYLCNDKIQLIDTRGRVVLKLEDDEPCAWGVKTVKISNTDYTTSTFPWYYPNPVVWADEFGLLKNNGSSTQSIAAMNSLVAYFKTKPQVTKWFWYKTTGNDGQIPEWKIPWVMPTPLIQPNFITILEPPNVALHSAEPPTSSNRTSIGNNYRCLQSDNPPPEVTRLSWHDYVTPTFTNIKKWPQSPFNEVLIYPFSSNIVPAMSNWTYWGSAKMHVDGVTLSSSCNVTSLKRTFTSAEMATIHNESDYFVVESGFDVPLPGDRFTLTIQGPGGETRIKSVESFGYFGGEANPLAQNGMAGVIEFKKYLNPGESLKGIEFERGITLATCSPNSWSFHRVYFARQNPVGIYGAGNFQGIVYPNEIYEGGKLQEIPVAKGTCSDCPTDIDAASKAAGFTYSDSERLIRWKPPFSRDGEHPITFSIVNSGKTYYKSFKLHHIRGKNLPLSSITLLLE